MAGGGGSYFLRPRYPEREVGVGLVIITIGL